MVRSVAAEEFRARRVKRPMVSSEEGCEYRKIDLKKAKRQGSLASEAGAELGIITYSEELREEQIHTGGLSALYVAR